MDSEEYRLKIEREILDIMEEKLITRQMDAEKARNIARYILDSLHPHMTLEQIYTVAKEFDDHFRELAPITEEVTLEHEEWMKKQIGNSVVKLVKQGNIEEASQIVNTKLKSDKNP